MDLKNIAKEIRDIVSECQKKHQITFDEDSHTYTMLDENGNLTSDWPSVSKVLKLFYDEFDAEGISYKKAKGDLKVQQELLDEWKAAGDYSTNMGSRVHYLLETEIVNKFELTKEVRQPIYDCDFTQILKGDSMVVAGKNFLDLMVERNGVILDTEMVLGSSKLGYTGQPDKTWLFMNKEKTGFGLVITDWKTNKIKNFEVNYFTTKMKPPFNEYPNNALGHYYLQLPLYGRLLLEMLKGSKYEGIKLYGCIIVLLRDDGTYVEYRIPNKVIDTIMSIDIKELLKKLKK